MDEIPSMALKQPPDIAIIFVKEITSVLFALCCHITICPVQRMIAVFKGTEKYR
ncbi:MULTISPECIES: hypothetical protein [unclassified Corynebacterium]|uniref:hypothetical protein n=1 Tax=unclassified Corynebacterium TaxID=2624378 RepID=UPI00163DB3B8|nr:MULTISPECIES: hypothetical protein [unclassified Corynebacterium]